MTTCWRCGIDFDHTDDPAEALCSDCFSVEHEGEPAVVLWKKGGRQRGSGSDRNGVGRLDVMEYRATAILRQWNKNLNDQEIAKIYGINDRTVMRWRQKLGLPARSRGGGDRMTPEGRLKQQEGYRKYVEEQRAARSNS